LYIKLDNYQESCKILVRLHLVERNKRKYEYKLNVYLRVVSIFPQGRENYHFADGEDG